MSRAILVTYATRYGSTQEVAEAVAETLRADGLAVDIRPMREVRTLEGYSAVVLGAPLYIGRLLRDAKRFLSLHQQALIERRVAVFALGPGSDEEKDWQDVRAQLDKELVRYSWLNPVAHQLFGGRFDPARLRFPDSLLAKLPASPLHGTPARDLRDWDAIRAWAGSLATELGPAWAQ